MSMLQMTELAHQAHRELQLQSSFPPAWETMEELEERTDDWMARWLERRSKAARGPYYSLLDGFDRIVRTDLKERTDDPEVSPERKLRIVRSLHRTNTMLGVYRHYFRILTPLIKQIAAERNRSVRLLELASGSGELAMQLARIAAKKDLPLEVTGSDYVEAVVLNAAKRAERRGLDVRFLNINAFDMGSALVKGQYDMFLIVGTMHHFKPGKLAVMMAQARRFSDPGSLFVGIDPFRSIPMVLFLPIAHLITFLPDHIYDAWLTARKAYTLCELEQIARIALPDAPITVAHSIPGLTFLKALL